MDIETLKNLALIISIGVLIGACFQYIKATRFPTCSAVMITGPMGSGKTWTSVSRKVKWFKKHLFKYRLHKVFCKIPLLGWLFGDKVGQDWFPKVYTNFPVCLCRKSIIFFWANPNNPKHKKFFYWSYVLKREHVLLQEDLEEFSSGIFDELGLSANQWSFDDDNIQSQNINENYNTLDVWVKFLRQFYTGDEGQFLFIEQTASSISKPLRARIGIIYNMIRTYRWLWISPFQKTEINILMNSEDTITNVNSVNEDDDERTRFFFRWVGYKIPFISYRHYDSRCYRLANTELEDGSKLGFTPYVDFDNWVDNPTGFLTNYVPDLRMSETERFERDLKVATFKKRVRDTVNAPRSLLRKE